MKNRTLAPALLFLSASLMAQTAPVARKPCEDLKAEITKKLDAKNVVGYSLDVVDKGKESPDGKVVGTCDGGTKSIIYSKTVPITQAKADTKKPQ